VFVSTLTSMQSALVLLYYHLLLVRLYKRFSKLSHRRNNLHKNVVESKKCDFILSKKKLPETFRILRRIQPDVIINVHVTSCKVPLFLWDFNEIWILLTDRRKTLKCQIWSESIQCEQSCSMKIDRTDMTKLMVAFLNFANAIKKFTARDYNIWEWAKIMHQ